MAALRHSTKPREALPEAARAVWLGEAAEATTTVAPAGLASAADWPALLPDVMVLEARQPAVPRVALPVLVVVLFVAAPAEVVVVQGMAPAAWVMMFASAEPALLPRRLSHTWRKTARRVLWRAHIARRTCRPLCQRCLRRAPGANGESDAGRVSQYR